MGLMTRAASFLNRALPAAAGGTLTYTRGATSASVVGFAGQEQRDEVLSPNPATRNTDRERDFLIEASELAAFGAPAEGDKITETVAGVTLVWEVRPRDREPVARFSDLTRTRYRIHTRRK